MYIRVLEVLTVPSWMVHDAHRDHIDLGEAADAMPLVSMMRQYFFVLQLFKEQMFSMDELMAWDLAGALATNRKECCLHKRKYAAKYEAVDFPDWEVFLIEIHCDLEHPKSPEVDDEAHKEDMKRLMASMSLDQRNDLTECKRLQAVWWHKFDEIRECPNERQCVKFDRISDILKRFFMEQSKEREIRTGNRKWIISFEEILTVYPNVEELHFMNEYRFDDGVLQRLIKQIEREDNPLRKVVFLYFDYMECGDGSGKPMESATFQDPDTLNYDLITKLMIINKDMEWNVVHGRNKDSGYKVMISGKPRIKIKGVKLLKNLSSNFSRSLSSNVFKQKY